MNKSAELKAARLELRRLQAQLRRLRKGPPRPSVHQIVAQAFRDGFRISNQPAEI